MAYSQPTIQIFFWTYIVTAKSIVTTANNISMSSYWKRVMNILRRSIYFNISSNSRHCKRAEYAERYDCRNDISRRSYNEDPSREFAAAYRVLAGFYA